MAATIGLFFDDTLISTEEAPRRILKRSDFTYRAILKKRFGPVTADDFLKYARRFSVLCNEVYKESKLELQKNKSIPLGSDVALASQGQYEGELGETLDINQLNVDSFREIFKHSSSLVLIIQPTVERKDICYSFSQIRWTRDRQRTIFFYSQDGGKFDPKGPLHNLLIRKMFYVSGVAPNLNFAVKFGVGAFLNEAEGKRF